MISFSNDILSNEYISQIMEDIEIPLSDNGASLDIVIDKSIKGIEITTNEKTVKIKCSEKVFVYRALGLILEQKDSEFHIVENARFDTNGLMLDCSRNAVINMHTLKQIVRMLALMGMNNLLLYMEDTYEIDSEPFFGYMRGRYSKTELNEIDEYASSFGIEVIPCIQTLSHLGVMLKWPCYAEIKDYGEILLIDSDETYDLIEKMIATCKDRFSTNKIHIGMDEADMVGRGKYYDIHGDTNKFDLMCRHLEKVTEICRKYELEPMIWSDMFFSLANNGNYRGRNPLPENIKQRIPKDVKLVYWEYLKEEYEQYDWLIKNHKEVSNTVFAGGAWKWMSFLPSITPSIRRTKTALNACAENGIREVFTTAWGDDGCDASIFSILPVIQVQAELCFNDSFDDEYLQRRFKTCTGGKLEDFNILDMPDLPKELNDGLLNPNKYLLYQDVLLGIFDCHMPDGISAKYSKLKEKAFDYSKNNKFSYIFETAGCLFSVLELKSELGKRLRKSYKERNMADISDITLYVLPELIQRVQAFRKALEKQWMTENKTFGVEVQIQRLGGLEIRLLSIKDRLRVFLRGETDIIAELEETPLPFLGENKEFARFNEWKKTISTSIM